MDKISLWFRRNLMLPPGERWKFYPQVAFSDGCITISEKALREILWSRNGDITPLMNKVFGKRDGVEDLSFSLFVDRTNHSRRTMGLQEYIQLKDKSEEERKSNNNNSVVHRQHSPDSRNDHHDDPRVLLTIHCSSPFRF